MSIEKFGFLGLVSYVECSYLLVSAYKNIYDSEQ